MQKFKLHQKLMPLIHIILPENDKSEIGDGVNEKGAEKCPFYAISWRS